MHCVCGAGGGAGAMTKVVLVHMCEESYFFSLTSGYLHPCIISFISETMTGAAMTGDVITTAPRV